MTGLLYLLGFFLLFSAAGMMIAGVQRRQSNLIGGAGIAAILGILFILAAISVVNVSPTERLVVFNRVTGDLSEPRNPGIAFINPITTSYTIYDVSRQTYTMSSAFNEGDIQGDDAVRARTADGQEVLLDVTVIYAIDPQNVNQIHVNWPQERYQAELIRPLLRSVIRDAVSLFGVDSIVQERANLDKQIEDTVIPALNKEGFLVIDILVRDVNFAPEYAAAIESAQVAEVQIREQEFRVRTAEQEAEQRKARAQGEADARIIEAEAEAEALRLVAEVLAENPQLLQYQYVQNLSDNIQIMALPANSPYIFDMTNLPTPVAPTPEATPSD